MIFPIRYKLLLYFFVLILLLSSVGLFYYKSSQRVVKEYDDSFESFLLLNETSQQTNLVVEKLQAFFVRKDPSYLNEYYKEKENLLNNQKKLTHIKRKDNMILIKSYENMIDSFVNESDFAIASFKNNQVSDYYLHLNEATKIADFIQESTLSLLNEELNNYEKFYYAIEERNQLFKNMTFPLFLSTFLLSFLIALWISGGITRPISNLSKAADEISRGFLNGEEVEVTTKDELKQLTEIFNQMRMNICELVKEIKEKSELDKLLKELELKSLQNQINPHFLFNTLNTVSKMAYLEEAEKTSRLIEAISAILRYNLGNLDKPSTLKNEVNIVQEYFYIQKTRFGERIQFLTNINEDCLDIKMPTLILQPLIENAFIHGVESYEEDAVISLSVFYQTKHICIEILDNGVGMNEVTKRRITGYINGLDEDDSFQPQTSNGHSTGIGVKNVIRRLQIFYQTTEIVEIDSELQKGTTFRILIPFQNVGGMNLVKNINS